MTATKAKRKAARRKRLPGTREPNGRLSRRTIHTKARAAETERAAMQTGIDARMRLFGLSEADARQPDAGSVIGRMKLRGDISDDQHRAALAYLAARNAYHSAIGTKSDTGGHPPPETASAGSYDDFCAASISRWDRMRAVVTNLCQDIRSPAPASALDNFVVRDVHVHELAGDLRLALNAIHRLLSGERRKAA